MKSFNYNSIAKYLTLHFCCPNCGEKINSDTLEVPPANYFAENASESENSDEYDVFCDNCDWSSNVSLYTSMYDGYGEIDELNEEASVDIEEEIPEE